MYCPICREEHREGFTWCSNCHASLVEQLPAEEAPESDTFTSVFEGDAGSATVVCAMLEGAGIEAWLKDEEAHGVLPNLGPVEVVLHEENEKAALEAIKNPTQGMDTNYDDSHATTRNSQNHDSTRKVLAAREEGKERNSSRIRNQTHGKGHQGGNKRRQDKRS